MKKDDDSSKKTPTASDVDPLVSRVRILYVTPQLMVTLLLKANQYDCIDLPICKDAPDDMRVGEVHYFFERNQFGIKLMSKEFDKVEPGQICPEIQLSFETIKIPKKFKEQKTC